MQCKVNLLIEDVLYMYVKDLPIKPPILVPGTLGYCRGLGVKHVNSVSPSSSISHGRPINNNTKYVLLLT